MNNMAGPPPNAAPPGVGPQPAPAPPKKKPGLFAPKPKPGANLEKNVAEIAAEMNNIGRRLRVLEERYTSLRKKTQVTDQNMLNANKKVMTEVQAGHAEGALLRGVALGVAGSGTGDGRARHVSGFGVPRVLDRHRGGSGDRPAYRGGGLELQRRGHVGALGASS